jgi:hypothetical protein
MLARRPPALAVAAPAVAPPKQHQRVPAARRDELR